jgi:hypothetical protein
LGGGLIMPITIAGSGTIGGISAGGLPDASIVTADIADANITAAKLSGAQSGSAPIYAARAWVNFNGTGTVAIRASGNVSSITDNGTGNYTVNFTTAMVDGNYSVLGMLGDGGSGTSAVKIFTTGGTFTTAPVKMDTTGVRLGATNADIFTCCVSVFR